LTQRLRVITTAAPKKRVFLFLQGPHGPFFFRLAQLLEKTGAHVWRVGFNAGDRAFWHDKPSYIPFRALPETWPEAVNEIFAKKGITDLVLYGDTRHVHAEAIEAARARDIRIHVFEEGYLRPYWISYERGGSNGHSPLIDMPIEAMRADRQHRKLEPPVPPSHWGDTRQHVFYGALYHWFVLFWNRSYPHFRPHRAMDVRQEFRLYLKRLLLMPVQALDRFVATRRIKSGGFPYHLALLQLEHDSAFQAHSPFATQSEFIRLVIESFCRGAPPHHHLVFKAHPLEDGRAPLRADINRMAAESGVSDRIHFVRGGKLAALLDEARTAVTVNSTAGQQALWRGIPLRVFGAAVYAKPELVSNQPLPQFFASPERPDIGAYRDFRDYLLQTSQLAGSFYAAKGRQQVLRRAVDLLLSEHDPYSSAATETAAHAQQFRVVR
jgi:capsular polysaccharide export protein